MQDPALPPTVVRRAAPADAELLARFNARMALETEGKHLDPARLGAGTRAVFEDGARGFYAVAERAGAAVGCLLVTREWSDWRNGWFWWIQSVYVAPEARRSGVYTALYRWLESEARAGDARDGARVVGIRLYVERANAAAQATYAALGMHPAHYQLYEVDFVLGVPSH